MGQPAGTHDRLLALIDDFAGIRVAVFGDLLADEFIYGQIARVSREAPVLILDYDSTEIVPGGAGNAAKNVAALGGTPSAIGVVGADETGERLVAALGPAVWRARPGSAARLSHADQDAHPRRRRALGQAAGRADRSRRVARRCRWPIAGDRVAAGVGGGTVRRPARVRLRHRPRHAGGRAPAIQRFAGPGRRAPVLVDSRYALLRFRGMTTCTPNEAEVEQIFGITDRRESAGAREGRTRAARRRRKAGAVLITRGSRGMALFEPDRPTEHIPISGSDQIADVTGAGDTVIATMTLALAAGATFERGGAPGQLRGRAGGDEARHRDGHGRRAARRGSCRAQREAPARDLDGYGAERRCTVGRRRWQSREPRTDTWESSSLAQSSSISCAPTAPPAGRSPSPTAVSTCCTSATSAICRPPPPKRIA